MEKTQLNSTRPFDHAMFRLRMLLNNEYVIQFSVLWLLTHFQPFVFYPWTKFSAKMLFLDWNIAENEMVAFFVCNLLTVIILVTWYLSRSYIVVRVIFCIHANFLLFQYGVHPPSWILTDKTIHTTQLTNIATSTQQQCKTKATTTAHIFTHNKRAFC